MNSKQKTLIFVALILLCELPTLSAQQPSQTFKSSAGFSIKLPADWKRVDRGTINEAMQQLAENIPAMKSANAIDVFQPSTIRSGIGYPRIIVSAIKAEKITPSQLKELVLKENGQVQQAADSFVDKQSWIQSAQIRSLNYDEKGQFMWMSSEETVSGVGTICLLQASFPTDSGLLSFQFASPKSDADVLFNFARWVVGGIEITNRAADGPSRTQQLIVKVGTFLVAAFVYGLIQRERKKSKKSPIIGATQPQSNSPASVAVSEVPEPVVEDEISKAVTRVGEDVHFFCHSCGQPVATNADSVGQQFHCPSCGVQLEVPSIPI